MGVWVQVPCSAPKEVQDMVSTCRPGHWCNGKHRTSFICRNDGMVDMSASKADAITACGFESHFRYQWFITTPFVYTYEGLTALCADNDDIKANKIAVFLLKI